MMPTNHDLLMGVETLVGSFQARTMGDLHLRFAHQPNLFASGYVLSTAALAERVIQRRVGASTSLEYVVVDYDSADDERTFRAPLPRLTPEPGVKYHRVITRLEAKNRIACSIASADILNRLSSLRRCMIEATLCLRHGLAQANIPVATRAACRMRVDHCLDALESFLRAHPRFSRAAAHHNVWVLEKVFRCTHVKLVAGFDWLSSHSQERLNFTKQLLKIWPAWNERLIWSLCEKCLRRVHTKVRIVAEDLIVESHVCPSCRVWSKDEILRFDRTVPTEVGPCPKFVPSVRLDDILDRLIGEHDFSVYYPGSQGHVRDAGKILVQATQGGLISTRTPAHDWCPSTAELSEIWDDEFGGSKYLGLLGRVSACVSWSVSAGDYAELFEERVDALMQRRFGAPVPLSLNRMT
ncbi:hypothetical protein [Streptomyces massasporeus]|uniref:hypothetical protein n=1 Tax=Streptomyces massasporeus TaxID=67324 RepID=UPI0036C4E8C5